MSFWFGVLVGWVTAGPAVLFWLVLVTAAARADKRDREWKGRP